MKIGIKIILAFSVISIISISVIGIFGITIGKKYMEVEAYEKLTAIRELKSNRIEAYFEQIRNQLLSSSESYMIVDAMKEFQTAFYEIDNLNIPKSDIDKSLSKYYEKEFLLKLNDNSIKKYKLEDIYPVDNRTKKLQYLYISNNQNKTGEKQLLATSNDDSDYSKYHSTYHPIFKSFVDKFGYYDIFLVDTAGHIVYSVYKEVDFATSLKEDVYKETNLAKVTRQALLADDKDFIKMIDFDNYLPSYNGHAAFIASPIFDNGKNIGALVFQLPIDRINNIMTDNQQWEKVGLGKSGETYIVGADLLLRNQSRFLIEDKENYIATLDNLGYSDDTINQIKILNNSIGLQKVKTTGVENALGGDTGTFIFKDYRGISVLSSYRPLTIQDVNWVIMSEVDEDEALSAIDIFINRMILLLIILIILIPINAILFARSITKPLLKLTNVSKQMAAGNLKVETGLCQNDEIGALACSFDKMAESIRHMMDKLEEANTTLEEKVKIRTKEVEEAHYKTQSIIDNANDAIITIDERQNIVLFNAAATDIFGYTEEEILGKSLIELLPESYMKNHHKHIDSFKSSSENSKQMNDRAEVMGKRRNGNLFYAEVSISKQKIDDEYQFTAFLKDISIRKEMEAKIEEANQRMEDELNVGRDIQMSMLPLIFPAFPDHSEFNIYALLESAREVGGDFYDFYFLDEHKFLFTIADVSGKGVPSALFMAVCKTLIKSRATDDHSPSSIVTHVNDELSRDNPASMFVTLFLCIIDLSTGELKYTNAGHNPPYLKRVNKEIETLDTLHGPVIGAMEDYAYSEGSLKMHANDLLLLFTDGVNEAMDKNRNLYSNQPIIDNLKNYKGDTIIDDVKNLYNSVMDFQGDAEQADDITILGFEYLEPIISNVLNSQTVILKNDLTEIDKLNDSFNEFCEQYKIPSAVYRKFNIVFDELINNIVSYGYTDDDEHELKVIINITEDKLVVSIEDDATAFNPLNLATPDTEASIEDREIGGLGVHMVKKLMDNVSYKRFIKKNMTTLYKTYK